MPSGVLTMKQVKNVRDITQKRIISLRFVIIYRATEICISENINHLRYTNFLYSFNF